MMWESFDDNPPTEAGFYQWKHKHPQGFWQEFYAEMRVRGAGRTNVLSPDFDHWDGYRVSVPTGFVWKPTEDEEAARRAARKNIVSLPEIAFRPCPFCGTSPTLAAAQCGIPGGGNGVWICAKPQNYNTWRVEQCCRLIGFNGFKSPFELASVWNAYRSA